jgi:hypothetical protein
MHLWAVDCAPCVAELPLLRDMIEGIKHGPLGRQVRFVFVTETYEDDKLSQFLAAHRAELPQVPIYRTEQADSPLRATLQTDTQPVTLLIEPTPRGPIIRHALLGTIKTRRSELANALTRLVQISK